MSGRNGGSPAGDGRDTGPVSDSGDGTTDDRTRGRSEDWTRGRSDDGDAPTDDRWLGAGVAAFVAVHLLAMLVFDGLTLPALVGLEAAAVGLLLAGDAHTAGRGAALPAAAGAFGAAGSIGVALGPAGLRPWVVAAGLLAAGGALLYVGRRYDRYLAGGKPA